MMPDRSSTLQRAGHSSIEGVERQTWPQIARRTAATEAEAQRCAIVGRVCSGTRIGRSPENVPSRHSGEPFSTVSHPPKPWHIGQTVNVRGFTYALYTLEARQGKGRGYGLVLLLPSPRWSEQGILSFYSICR